MVSPTNVLNNNEELIVDDSLSISIGSKTLFLKEEHEITINDIHTNQTTWLPEKYVDGASCILLNNHWIPLSKLDKHLKLRSRRFVKCPIGMVPPDGYSRRDNYSKSSIQWLKWIMTQKRIHIRHALNGGE